MPENYRFGGGAAETIIDPFVLIAMFIAIGMTLFLPRKRAVIPLLLISLLTPYGQTMVVGGIHLYVGRIVLVFACGRLFAEYCVMKRGVFLGGFNPIDKAFVLWSVCHATAFILLHQQGAAVVNQFGNIIDCLGGYFVLRFMIQEQEGLQNAIMALCFVAVIAGLSMVGEQLTHTNLFGFIGGQVSPQIREDRIRSVGPFAHPILAGVYGGTVLPLFLWFWWASKRRIAATFGVVAAILMVITSASSTPVMACGAGVFGLCLWSLRKRMRAIRWIAVAAILGLALVMKAPVWFLIARLELIGGSSGYHRAQLVDQFVNRWQEWWLLGTDNNQEWGWFLWDAQNQFVCEGLTGGIIALFFFVLIVSRSFGLLGKARKAIEFDREQEWLIWTLGSVLFAHCVAFWGSNYFDQIRIWWFGTLAMIVAITSAALAEEQLPIEPESALLPTP